MTRVLDKVAWALMGVPVGVRKPNAWLMRHGPYMWGIRLQDREWLR